MEKVFGIKKIMPIIGAFVNFTADNFSEIYMEIGVSDADAIE